MDEELEIRTYSKGIVGSSEYENIVIFLLNYCIFVTIDGPWFESASSFGERKIRNMLYECVVIESL